MEEGDSCEAISGCFGHVLVLQRIQEYPYLAGLPPKNILFPFVGKLVFAFQSNIAHQDTVTR